LLAVKAFPVSCNVLCSAVHISKGDKKLMETFSEKQLKGAFLKELWIKDMHWIHLAQDAGSYERHSEFSEILLKLKDYQLFKEGCSMDFVARLDMKSCLYGSYPKARPWLTSTSQGHEWK
jgi:hypothetical protein